jgi:hypothetical protein
MNRKEAAALATMRGSESADELVGVLTAISVVSRRLARRLALLERSPAERNGDKRDGITHTMSAHADSG